MSPARRSVASRAGGALASNLAYKILSVLIALALWFIVRDERVETQVTFAVDLQPPAELVVSNEAIPELNVGVAGTRASLDRLRRGSLVLPIKVKATEPGVFTLHIRPEDLGVPPGVEVVHVSPSTLGIRVEAKRTRPVPVRPRLVLEEDSAWRVKKVTVTPDRVRIAGPASVVAAVDQVWTEAIVIPPKSGDPITGTWAVSLPHPQIRVEDSPSVSVTVELEEKPPAGATPAPPAPTPARVLPKKKLQARP